MSLAYAWGRGPLLFADSGHPAAFGAVFSCSSGARLWAAASAEEEGETQGQSASLKSEKEN